MTDSYQTDEEKKRFSAQLTNLDLGKEGVGATGRVSYKLPLDKESEVEAYADLAAQKRKGQKLDFSTPMLGVGYTRRFNFKQGGKVKSASARADGIAQRGKTKGRMV